MTPIGKKLTEKNPRSNKLNKFVKNVGEVFATLTFIPLVAILIWVSIGWVADFLGKILVSVRSLLC